MRTLRKNKQKMFYALPIKEDEVIYDRDENGNIIYESYVDMQGNVIYITDLDGDLIPRTRGNTKQNYHDPVEFYNGISGRLSEVMIEAFGINDSSIYAQMDYRANEYPFVTGTLIWKKSEVGYKEEDGETVIDKTSADYEVVGILDEFPNVWSCLLKRLIGSGEENS